MIVAHLNLFFFSVFHLLVDIQLTQPTVQSYHLLYYQQVLRSKRSYKARNVGWEEWVEKRDKPQNPKYIRFAMLGGKEVKINSIRTQSVPTLWSNIKYLLIFNVIFWSIFVGFAIAMRYQIPEEKLSSYEGNFFYETFYLIGRGVGKSLAWTASKIWNVLVLIKENIIRTSVTNWDRVAQPTVTVLLPYTGPTKVVDGTVQLLKGQVILLLLILILATIGGWYMANRWLVTKQWRREARSGNKQRKEGRRREAATTTKMKRWLFRQKMKKIAMKRRL